MILGLVFSVVGTVLHHADEAASSSFFSHVGIGLLAAGLLTATVEAATHRRNHQRDRLAQRRSRKNLATFEQRSRDHLDALQKTTAVTILREFIPEDVFTEVQNQLISKPFARRDFRCHFGFSWEGAKQDTLSLRTSVEYKLRNVSVSPQVFRFRAVETWNCDGNEDSVDITHAYVMRSDDAQARNLADQETGTKRVVNDSVVVEDQVHLKPGESVHVRWRSIRRYFERDHTTVTLTLATRGFELSASHPDDLVVDLGIHHPDEEKFRKDVLPGETKWVFEGGFLPFQGVTLSWHKKPDATRVRAMKLLRSGEDPAALVP